MEIIEVSDLKKMLFGAIPIGYGCTSICFLLRDKTVFKQYYTAVSGDKVVQEIEKLEMINSVQNELFIGPNRIYIKDGHVIGYGMQYIKAKNLKKMKKGVNLSEILKAYPILEEKIELISQKKFNLVDVYRENILFKDLFYVIDLDYGRIDQNRREDDILHSNKRALLISIIGGILGEDVRSTRNSEELFFKSHEIEELYRKVVYDQTSTINDLFDCIKEEIKNENPKIRDLRRARKKVYEVM